MRIYKIAAIKDRLQKYKEITDPYVIFFIYNYEQLIPWADIKVGTATQDINNHVKNVLLTEVKMLMKDGPHENNYYHKDFDIALEYNNNPLNPDIKKAYELKDTNPRLAQDILKYPINEGKAETFRQWETEMSYYTDKPTLVYYMYKKMLEESPKDSRSMSPSCFKFALQKTVDEIKANPSRQVNLWKGYKDEVNRFLFSDLKYVNKKGSGWKHILSGAKQPEGFEERVDFLYEISKGTTWCVGWDKESYTRPYLSKGDFWIYADDNGKGGKRTSVAIRLEGTRTGEIRDKWNQDPIPFAEQVLDLYAAEGLDPISCGSYSPAGKTHEHFKTMTKVYDGINKKLESGKITWKDITFTMYQQLSETNRDKMPETERERVAREFMTTGIQTGTRIPPSFEKYEFIKEAQVMAWTSELRKNPKIYETASFPANLKEREDIKTIRLESWSEKIGNNESLLESAPADIINSPAIYEKVVDKYIQKITTDPLEYMNVSLAMRRGQQRIIDLAATVVVPAIVTKLTKNPMFYDHIAYEFVNEPTVINAFKEGWKNIIRQEPKYFNGFICQKSWARDVIKQLQNSKEGKDAFKEGLEAKKRPQAPARPQAPQPKTPQQPPPAQLTPAQPQPQQEQLPQPPQDDRQASKFKIHKLVCSNCNSRIEKISKARHPSEDIYHCPNCENIGTIDEI